MKDERSSTGLAQQAYQQLRDDITRCSIAPGARITQSELIEEYGFGQAAIREALTRLNQDGLVEVIPREGYLISQMTLKRAQDLFETRLIVECEVAKLAAARFTGEFLDRLMELQRRVTQPEENLDQLVINNSSFHIAVVEVTRNDRLIAMMTDLHDELARYLYLFFKVSEEWGMPPELDYAHERLIDLLAAGDESGAALATYEEIHSVRDRVLSALRESPSLLSVNLANT